MIYRLRKKFISICVLSFIAVFMVVFALIYLITTIQTNQSLDMHTDIISENDGKFPSFGEIMPSGNRPMPPEGFNQESPFTTRYFTVRFHKESGTIHADTQQIAKVTLTGDRHPTITVENNYAAVKNIEFDRLFDRFYRADKARTYGTGFGIGLSMAKAIVEKHHGSITAYNIENNKIGFKVRL